jgi:hypothetical protein
MTCDEARRIAVNIAKLLDRLKQYLTATRLLLEIDVSMARYPLMPR